VKALALVGVFRQGIAVGNAFRVMAGYQHVRLADSKGFGIDLLPKELHTDGRVKALQCLFGQGQHAAGPAGRVVDLTDDAPTTQFHVVAGNKEINDQLDYLAGGEVLPCGLVGDLREAADQFLEEVAHLDIRYPLRV